MIIKYKCSNGDGTYSNGIISHKRTEQTARDYLTKIFHSIIDFEIISIDTVKKEIIKVMQEWNKDPHPYYSAMWYGYSKLSDDTGFEKKDLKKAMKQLLSEGKVKVLYTSNDESRVAGRGLFLC